MITLTLIIAWVMLIRWQVRHLHAQGADVAYNNYLKNGDVVTYRGLPATVIDCKTDDMVIRRHLSGLFIPWIRGNREKLRHIEVK